MKTIEKCLLIRIGLGDYAMGKRGRLYKEILNCARQNGVISASVFNSSDGFLVKGKEEVVRLFGGMNKSKSIIIEALLKQQHKEKFLSQLRILCKEVNEPVVVSVSQSEIETFGLTVESRDEKIRLAL